MRLPFLALLFLVMGAAGQTIDNIQSVDEKNEEGRKRAAKDMREWMNPYVNPCYDFYDFACGNYVKKHTGESLASHFETRRREVDEVLLRELTAENATVASSTSIDKLKKLFKQCIAGDNSDDILGQIERFGGFPIVDENWNASTFDLTALLIETDRTRDLNIFRDGRSDGVFYTITPYKNEKNNTWSVRVDRGTVTLNPKAYIEPYNFAAAIKQARDAAITIVSIALQISKQKVKPKRITNDLDDIFDFETKLVKIMSDIDINEDDVYLQMVDKAIKKQYYFNKSEDEQLEAQFDVLQSYQEYIRAIDWNRYFDAFVSKERLEKMKTEKLIQTSPAGLFQLVRINRLLNQTKPRVLQNYAIFRYLLRANILERLNSNQTTKACLKDISEHLRRVTSAVFVAATMTEEQKHVAVELAERLRKAFHKILKDEPWLDEKTRANALEKLHKMIFLVGYPTSSKNFSVLDEYYETLNLPHDTYLKNAREVSMWKNARFFEEPPKRGDDLVVSMTVVNAMYVASLNELYIHGSMLNAPFFDVHYPMVINFGRIGAVVGHEITHGFDTSGAKYGWDGSLKNWWLNTTMLKFQNKSACLVEQYGKITEPLLGGLVLQLNGQLTLKENIADHGGAYHDYMAEKGAEPPLPGLEGYSSDQLYFLAYAQNYCSHEDINIKMFRFQDDHSPDRYRVNEVLKNIPEFAEAFHCPAGLPMNPEKRCTVW